MIICPNCHHENAAGSVFCGECGQRLPEATTANAQSNVASHEAEKTTTRGANQPQSTVVSPSRQSREAISPKQRPSGLKWVILVAVLVIVLGGGALVYRGTFSKQQQVAKITQALVDGDKATLAKSLVSDDPSLKINETTVAPLATYVKQHSSYAQDAQTDLPHNGYTSDHTLKVVTAGHQLLVVPVYKLQVTTMHPKIETNLKNADIEANGTKLSTTKYSHENYTAGPLMPGTYHFKLVGGADSASKDAVLMGKANVNQKIKLLVATKTSSQDDTSSKDEDTQTATAGPKAPSVVKKHTGNSYDHLTSPAQTAVDRISDADGVDTDDYTYTESEPHTDVYEIKLYDRDTNKLTATYRYDNVNDILAKYDQSSGKFVEVD
ncbi:TcaA second domain-containing protein [Lactiplantibacillus garii]|nr:zinc-ribbon domain-containing protein [Lactiplantibacillus garii]